MCDEAKLGEWAKQAISRRRFGALAGAAAVAACAPGEANEDGGDGPGLMETGVTFETEDGTMDAFFVHPDGGKHPGVIFWPDIAGLREAKRTMARRLAGEGYSVLVLNPYYRDVAGEQFADFAEFIDESGFGKVGPWREKLTAEAIGRDALAAAGWLDRQTMVDTAKGIGTQGYCMGGPFTIWSAAAVPDRIKAAASFHGGGLVRGDDPMSPHNMLDDVEARLLIAIAEDDHEKDPSAKLLFAKAAGLAAVPAKIEVYEGDHGWTVPDSPAYAEPAAEKAYADLLKLYQATL
ncbi:MAG: dienelactone hydrolase family protein [Erythrobacter sp.]|uniref:dienelactone hydrolase family protein n=1 Tax=Erythrobacter sp. TaxID=1042 RepID=UPI0032EBA9B8